MKELSEAEYQAELRVKKDIDVKARKAVLYARLEKHLDKAFEINVELAKLNLEEMKRLTEE